MKFPRLALAFLLLSPPAHADFDCQGPFASLGDSAFVRQPTGRPLDPVYRANMERVMNSFAHSLDGDAAPGDFSAFLAEQHKLSVLGEKPGTYYWPETHDLANGRQVNSDSGLARSLAGNYRNNLNDPPPDLDLIQSLDLNAKIRADVEKYSPGRKPKTVMISAIPHSYFQPKITGLPESALPRYTNGYDGKVEFHYPPSRNVRLYVDEMAKSFEAVRAGLREEPRNVDAVLGNLSRYYHLIIVGHPFMRVNNSMAMAQVNVVLQRLGMKPVSHGDLDYVMRALDSDGASQAFLDHVKSQQ